MALKNPWVGYISRSHLQIKNSILQRLNEVVPEVTDHSESNILVIIISMFSGIAEMLNYYIDNMAQEAFITTARRYSSVVKHTRLIDYRIKAMAPSSVDVQVDFMDKNNVHIGTQVEFLIPKGTKFFTENNIEFLSVNDILVPIGTKTIMIPCQQKTFKDSTLIGKTDGTDGQVFNLGSDYVDGSLLLRVGDEHWDLVTTLGRSEPDDKHYIVDISIDKKAYIRFGDNVNGKKPEVDRDIIGSYFISQGSLGNVDINTINQSDFNFNSVLGLDIPNIRIFNPLKATGGTNYEDIDRIRRSAPLHLRTLDRAVTRQDYIDITMLAPGVDKATVHFECGKYVDIYISPNGGGIAQLPLLQTTKAYIDERKMITTFTNVQPAGESYIVLDVEATAKFRMDGIQTKSDILKALVAEYSYEKSDVNRKIRKSDIISLIDNLYKVDFLNLKSIYLKPYIRPINHNTQMLSNITINNGSTIKTKWRLQFDGNFMRLYKDNKFINNVIIGQPYTDPMNILTLLINPNNYQLGQEWSFTTYPFNSNIETDDFSVPIMRESDITVKVNEQLSI